MINQVKQYGQHSFTSPLSHSDDSFFTDEQLRCHDDVIEVDHLSDIKGENSLLALINGITQIETVDDQKFSEQAGDNQVQMWDDLSSSVYSDSYALAG